MTVCTEFRPRIAEGAIPAHSIVKPGAAATGVLVAGAATDKLIGTSDELAHVTGEMVDVSMGDIHRVLLGGAVAAGDALTSNASGAAIATTTAGNRYIGFAEIPGVAGDVITYIRSPGVY